MFASAKSVRCAPALRAKPRLLTALIEKPATVRQIFTHLKLCAWSAYRGGASSGWRPYRRG